MRKLLWATFGVALISMVFAGCKNEPTHTVQVTATEGGTVEGRNGEYKEGETVVFTAIPDDGYSFNKWSNGSTENPRTITIYGDITLTAEFVQNPLLTIFASDNGTIETDVNGRYKIGSNVTVTAKPDAEYYFTGWSDGSTENPRTITIGSEDISLTAYFFTPTVDLELESGTLWATCNLGAVAPWYYGNYYAWGETQAKNDFSWETYKYCKGTWNTLTKYCFDAEWGNDGFTDNLTTLLPEDDAATTVLGSNYSTPTAADWDELYSQCYWVWVDNYNNQNVSGYIVYKAIVGGDKGKIVYANKTPLEYYSLSVDHIFLPTAGRPDEASLYADDLYGCYWSASLGNDYPIIAHACSIDSSHVYSSGTDPRCSGFSVRPVRRK